MPVTGAWLGFMPRGATDGTVAKTTGNGLYRYVTALTCSPLSALHSAFDKLRHRGVQRGWPLVSEPVEDVRAWGAAPTNPARWCHQLIHMCALVFLFCRSAVLSLYRSGDIDTLNP